MKRCLILGVFFAVAATANAAPGAGRTQESVDAKVVPSRVAQQAQSSAPRHLSEQQRAELRKQLQQFNQQYTRRP